MDNMFAAKRLKQIRGKRFQRVAKRMMRLGQGPHPRGEKAHRQFIENAAKQGYTLVSSNRLEREPGVWVVRIVDHTRDAAWCIRRRPGRCHS